MPRAKKVLLFALILGIVGPTARAHADGFVSPWVGANFAHDPGDGRAAFGVTAGGMGAGIFGGEVDLGYSPRYFGTENYFGHNNVLNFMGNLIVGIPIGGTRGAGFRPYGTGGFGLIRTSIEGLFDLVPVKENAFGFNLGAGVMGFVDDHFGVRGDVRYFRTLRESDQIPNDFNVDLGAIHFWRASLGIVLR